MLLLTTTSDLVQVITGSALSTDMVTSYVDITTGAVTPGSFQVNTTTATTTTIVASPAASTQRQVKMISIRNNSSTTAQTVTVQKSSSGTFNITGAITLQAGETLYYQDMYGFSVRDINGQIKQTINATNTALTATEVGYGNASGILTGSSNFTYSSSGNLVVGAPSSGNALSVNGGTGTTIAVQAGTTTGSSFGIGIHAGTNASDNGLQVYNATGTNKYLQITGDGSGLVGYNGSGNTIVWNASGGVGLSVTPNTWGSAGTIELPAAGGISFQGSQGNFVTNAYYNGGWKYSTSNYATLFNNGASGAGGFYWSTAPSGTAGNAVTFTTVMSINNAGNVTHNAPTSGQTLTVTAGADLSGILINGAVNNVALTLNNTQSGATGNWQISSSATGSGFGAGNLVIGTNSSNYLSINSSGFVQAGYGLKVLAPSSGQAFAVNNSGNSAQYFYVGNTGSIYVSTLTTGTVYSNSGVLSNTQSSDARLKNTIQDTPYGLDDIMKIRPVTFLWDYDPKNEKRTQFGFIAQEVQDVMPDAIPTFEQEGETYLGIEKDAIYGALIKAVQEQQAQIQAQQEQINTLLAQITTLLSK